MNSNAEESSFSSLTTEQAFMLIEALEELVERLWHDFGAEIQDAGLLELDSAAGVIGSDIDSK